MMESGEIPRLLFVGQLKDYKAGPHPIAQLEIHYTKPALPAIVSIIEASGLTALVHPLTDDDMADHTTLAQWIGTPLDLDLSTLDPPGHNQGVARFGKADFQVDARVEPACPARFSIRREEPKPPRRRGATVVAARCGLRRAFRQT